MSGREIGRWLVLGLLLAACLAAFFVFGPRVPPVIRGLPAAEAP